jgi:hypothetical protein
MTPRTAASALDELGVSRNLPLRSRRKGGLRFANPRYLIAKVQIIRIRSIKGAVLKGSARCGDRLAACLSCYHRRSPLNRYKNSQDNTITRR